jgi:predicted RNase H-like nuclease (RuvC/YqgF family)
MTDGTAVVSLDALSQRLEKHSEEITTLQAAIHKYDKQAADLKPSVQQYNEVLRDRKELRRELAMKQKQIAVIAEFLQGTSLIDTRFPLFSQPQSEVKEKHT